MTFIKKFNNVNYIIINSIRRSLLSNISNYIFDEIDIIKNTTNIDNDMLIHRLTLIPITSSENLNIHVQIKNDTKNDLSFTTTDFNKYSVEVDNTNYWIYPDILIIILKPNEEIDLTLYTSVATAEIDAKYSHITNLKVKQDIFIEFNDTIFTNNIKSTSIEKLNLNTDILNKLKLRLPFIFDENNFLLSKLFIDLNLIDNINEIIEKEFFKIKDSGNFELSFDTINNKNVNDIYNIAVNQLIIQIGNLELNGNKLYCDYTLSNLILHFYRLFNKEAVISIYKKHPLDDFMLMNADEKFDLDIVKNLIKDDLIKYLV